MEASLLSIQFLYTTHIEKADSVRMEASLLSIQFLYTTRIEKADSLSGWRPLPFLYTLYCIDN